MATIVSNERIEVIDSLRGFALAGIVLVHFVEQFVASPFPEGETDLMVQGIPDYIIIGIIQIFFSGKFFALFSVLFGLSFYIQMNNAKVRRDSYEWRFIWRLTILFFIGLVHSMFYRGDILTIYAVLGVALPLFNRMSNKALLWTAALLMLGLGRFLIKISNADQGFFSITTLGADSEFVRDYFSVLKQGSIWEVFQDNLVNGLLIKIKFQFGIFNRGYLTLAYFLIGLWLGRIQLFENLNKHRSTIKNFMWYFLALALVALVMTGILFSQLAQPPDLSSWPAILAFSAMDLANIGMTGFFFTLFLVLYHGKNEGKLKVLAPYGRTALTNYVLQSVIGTFVFYGWGLAYLTNIRNITTFSLAVCIIILQVFISKWWMNRYNYGPLEWVWRCLTWGRKMRFVKINAA